MISVAKKVKSKSPTLSRKFDSKYLGDEPSFLETEPTVSELVRALSYYNYMYGSTEAKSFTLSYLKKIKYSKSSIAKLTKVPADEFPLSIGWLCRLRSNGSKLSSNDLTELVRKIKGLEERGALIKNEINLETNVVSIQDRIQEKASNLIADLEEQFDAFLKDEVPEFDIRGWFLKNEIKPAIAKKIGEHFFPIYEELIEAQRSTDPQLKEAYAHWKRPVLKSMVEFVKTILSCAENQTISVPRKPRKKKEKPVSVLVSKVKCKREDDAYGKGLEPACIIGAQTAFLFNTKYRTLSVYIAKGSAGLSVKGTTIVGFDETASETKKLRKPESVLNSVREGGKVVLRRIMSTIKCKSSRATGRLNNEVLILRTIK